MGYNRFGQDTDSSLPIGATVSTVITSNDSAKPNWLNLSLPNTLVDITTYPSFATVTQSNLTGTQVATNNLSTLLGTGTWDDMTFGSTYWANGVYWAIKTDGVASYARVFTSVDGITWVEKANLTKDASPYSRPDQCRITELSDGYVYVIATTGIYRTNNLGTSWTHLSAPSSRYWGDIAYNGVTYVLTDSAIEGSISTTTDFITFTSRHIVPYGSTDTSRITYSPTFSKFYVHSSDGSGNHKVSYSTDGLSGWTDATIVLGGTGTSGTGQKIVEFKGALVLCVNNTTGNTYKSTNGISWSLASNISNATGFGSGYWRDPILATPDVLYYQSTTSNVIAYVTDLTSSVPRNTSTFGNSTLSTIAYDTVNSRVIATETNSLTTIAIRYIPYSVMTAKVVMPVQNTLVRIY
jgi:hypothetical protein